jgi:predicted NBD/HSP70 family sugar kinase
LISQASLWELEQRLREQGLDPMAAYDERALQAPWAPHTQAWLALAASALAQAIVSATAFLDLEAVVVDGAASPALVQALIAQAGEALAAYSWEGLMAPPTLVAGSIGSDARALGGALLPLHAAFAPEHDLFLKLPG